MSYFSFKPICKISVWKTSGIHNTVLLLKPCKTGFNFFKTSQKEVFAITGSQKSLKLSLKELLFNLYFPKLWSERKKCFELFCKEIKTIMVVNTLLHSLTLDCALYIGYKNLVSQIEGGGWEWGVEIKIGLMRRLEWKERLIKGGENCNLYINVDGFIFFSFIAVVS